MQCVPAIRTQVLWWKIFEI